MIGLVLACHGELGSVLWNTVTHVVRGTMPHVAMVSVQEGDGLDDFRDKLVSAIEEVRSPEGVLVLTDMFGGTPSNVGLSMHKAGEIEVLTGVNLPMLLRAVQVCRQEETSLDAAAMSICEAGRGAIVVASRVLSQAAGTS